MLPPRWAIAITGACLACAHIEVETRTEVRPVANAEPVVLGSGTQVVDRAPSAKWMQAGPELLVQIEVRQRCRALRFAPVVRTQYVERSDREHTLIWEFGLAGVMGGLATFALASPSQFGGRARGEDGRLLVDNTAGYTAGGMFLGVAALSLIAGTIDAARLRDTQVQARALDPQLGEEVPCPEAVWHPSGRTLKLVTHGRTVQAQSDEGGRARFRLPPAKAGPSRTVTAAILIDDTLAVQVDFVVPYDSPDAHGHHGQISPAQAQLERQLPEGPEP